MSRQRLRILVSLLAMTQGPLMAWLGGYDFDTRGFGLAYLYGCSVFLFFMTYFYPGWRE